MQNLDAISLKTAELAALLDLTPRRVRQLAKEGTFRRGSGGKFPLQPSVRAYLAAKQAPEAAKWLVRKARADALTKEHALAALVATRTDPMGLWPQWLAIFNGHTSRIVALVLQTLPPRLVEISDPYRAQDILCDHLWPELNATGDQLEAATVEPFRTRFREERQAERAALARIEAERAAHAERGAKFNAEMDARETAEAERGVRREAHRRGNGAAHE